MKQIVFFARSLFLASAVFGIAVTRSAGAQTAAIAPADAERPLCLQLAARAPVAGVAAKVWQNVTGAWSLRPSGSGMLTVETSATGFDAVLAVYSSHSPAASLVGGDDDSGEGTNARVSVSVRGTEDYLVCAFAWDTSGVAIRASVVTMRLSAARGISLGVPASDTLGLGDDSTTSGSRYQLWRYTAPAAGRVAFTVSSSDFDPEMDVYRVTDGGLESLGTNDDGGDGLNSMLVLAVEPGEYLIAARAHLREGVGAYRVAVNTAATTVATATPGAGAPRRTGGPTAGRRWTADPSLLVRADSERPRCEQRAAAAASGVPESARGNVVSAWTLRSRRGGTMLIETAADSGDPIVAVYSRLPDGATVVGSDDDSGEGLNARVVFPVTTGADHLVCVYSLSSSPSATPVVAGYVPPRSARVTRRLATDVAQTAELWFDDDTTSAGQYFHNWQVTLTQPQRVVITVASSDFDPAVIAFASRAGQLDSIGYNDDGPQGLDSRLDLPLPPGQYVISPRAHNRAATGTYTVEMRLAGPGDSAVSATLPATTELMLGRAAEGSLAATDSVFSDGSYYDFWTFRAQAGQRLRIRMFSQAFTPYFGFGQARGGRFVFAEGSSGKPEGAEAVVTISETGSYVIRANSQGSGSRTGAYVLLVDPAADRPELPPPD